LAEFEDDIELAGLEEFEDESELAGLEEVEAAPAPRPSDASGLVGTPGPPRSQGPPPRRQRRIDDGPSRMHPPGALPTRTLAAHPDDTARSATSKEKTQHGPCIDGSTAQKVSSSPMKECGYNEMNAHAPNTSALGVERIIADTPKAPNGQTPSAPRRSSCTSLGDTRGGHRARPPTAAKGSRGRGGARRRERQHRRGGDSRPGCRLSGRGRRRQRSCRPRRRPCSRRSRQKRNCRPRVAASTSEIVS